MFVWVTSLWVGSYFSVGLGVRDMLTQLQSQMYATPFELLTSPITFADA